MNKYKKLIILSSVLAMSKLCLALNVIRTPKLSAPYDPNAVYVSALLDLVLSKIETPYKVVYTKLPMLQGRAIEEATKKNGVVDVLWSMTTTEREKKLIAIKIPIDKGVLGWRIPLVKKEKVEALSNVKSIGDLRRFTAGQGHDWPDTEILRSNNLRVVTSWDYETLFSMLGDNRFDYFPRSVMEIYSDLENHKNGGIAMNENIILHYPTAAYFFVTPRRPKLAINLEAGFRRAIADGSFDALFRNCIGKYINEAAINRRRVIEMENPTVDSALSHASGELWFRPKASISSQ